MSFKQALSKRVYNYSREERCPCPSYQFHCDHNIDTNDFFEVYEITEQGYRKVFICDEEEKNLFFNYIIDEVLPIVGEKTVLSAGHAVINLSDKYGCGESVTASTELGLEIISIAKKNYDYDYDYLVQYNDLYVEHDLTRESNNHINKYRDKMFNPFIIPIPINNLLLTYEKKIQRGIPLNWCTSKTMADKFKRYIKKKKRTDKRFSFEETEKGNNFFYNLHGEKVLVLHGDKPNCVAANVAMLRDIRYQISNDEVKDNYMGYIGIFPRCSKQNVLNGCAIAYDLFPNFDLKTFIIFYGDSCA